MLPSKELNAWLDIATANEREAMSQAAEVSIGYLYQLAAGRRFSSADVAARIATASKVMHLTSGKRLPEICRTTLCVACNQCPFAKACLTQNNKS